jgi:hypothetical protein
VARPARAKLHPVAARRGEAAEGRDPRPQPGQRRGRAEAAAEVRRGRHERLGGVGVDLGFEVALSFQRERYRNLKILTNLL